MAQQVISTANLRYIENCLGNISARVDTIDGRVETVNQEVNSVRNELAALRETLEQFVNEQGLANRRSEAETRLVKIRQEIDKKFGHYDEIRRRVMGILEATDLGMVHQQKLLDTSESDMLSVPKYWLVPCLTALSAWICNKKELAEKALKEAIQRDDEKTCLFFALVCRRADRKAAGMKWINRYLAAQNEEQLDRNAIIVLSAYANGLWGSDTEGKVLKTIDTWLDNLKSRPGFEEKQRKQWKQVFALQQANVTPQLDYTYLKKYSPTWPALEASMKGAFLHEKMDQYFHKVFDEEYPTRKLVNQLDETLTTLVKNFDEEEIPLRKQELLEQEVLACHGDEQMAQQHMPVRSTALETHRDFLQMLTDAAMNPQDAHADTATRKLAIALSRDWILEGYQDLMGENRSRIPVNIQLKMGDFQTKTMDGTDEEALFSQYDQFLDTWKANVMAGKELTPRDNTFKTIGLVVMAVGVLAFPLGSVGIGILLLIIGYILYKSYKNKKAAYDAAVAQCNELEKQREPAKAIIRAFCAEVVDYRQQYQEKDGESRKVLDFLQSMEPREFVQNRADAPRRVII